MQPYFYAYFIIFYHDKMSCFKHENNHVYFFYIKNNLF